jgi:hypothetical protein
MGVQGMQRRNVKAIVLGKPTKYRGIGVGKARTS